MSLLTIYLGGKKNRTGSVVYFTNVWKVYWQSLSKKGRTKSLINWSRANWLAKLEESKLINLFCFVTKHSTNLQDAFYSWLDDRMLFIRGLTNGLNTQYKNQLDKNDKRPLSLYRIN